MDMFAGKFKDMFTYLQNRACKKVFNVPLMDPISLDAY